VSRQRNARGKSWAYGTAAVVSMLGMGVVAPGMAWASGPVTPPATYAPGLDQNSQYNLQNIVGNRSVWNKWTGSGVDVALIDSGVAPVAGLSDPGKVVNGPDLTPESQNPATNHLDTFGHGTHMAGIIAGHDTGVAAATASGNQTAFMGTAPDARIVSVKVADAHGSTDVTQVIAGLDWVVQHAHDPGFNIRVINLSFGTDSLQGYLADPLAFATEQAWKHGIVVVVSAGNSGVSDGRLTDPALDPYVLAVGADDTNGTASQADDTIPSFSSRGNGLRNPDVVAPGAHVQSLRVPGSYIDNTYGSTGAINDRYFRGSGTSQAAAFVSGSVAQLLQEHPTYTPDQIKALLRGTASRLPNADSQAQGRGLIDMRAATGPYDVTGATQTHVPSVGIGSLDSSRGTAVLQLNGVALTGQQDIFGHAFHPVLMAAAETNASSWSGGTWNGSVWTGDSMVNGSWSGRTWSGNDWSGRTWSGRTWSAGSWDGRTWSGSNWSGRTWSGASWSDSSWSGRTWSSGDWS
jgi:serine protease AprX